jgi:hypothetical protein
MRKIRGLVLIVLALGSYVRAYEWIDEVTVWQTASVRHPDRPRAWVNRCALEHVPEFCYLGWRASLTYDVPTQRAVEALSLVDLALISAERGETASAQIYAQRVVRRFPQWPQGRIVCDTLDCD